MTRETTAALQGSKSLRQAAKQLGVNVSTLSRAIKAGRLPAPGGPRRKPTPTAGAPLPDSWQARVEAVYDLSSTERELVQLAQQALDIAHDRDVSPAVRLQAAGRFAALAKDLALPREEEAIGYAQAQTRRYPRSV